MKLYAVIDACNTPDFLDMLKMYDPPASCLYNPPLQAGMAERAPYLIELISDEVKAWLAKQTKPWGLYLVTESDTDFLKLRNHLRKYTFAIVPSSENPVFFRFYDPRTIWKITNVLDDWQLHAFLGPIEIISTYYEEQYKQDHFEERRKQFPNQIRMKTMYLTLTEDQFERINGTYEEEYIQELADHMMKYVDLSIIETSNNAPDKIHKEMLEHERDVKLAQISHLTDQNFLIEHSEKKSRIDPSEKAYFQYSNQTRQWQRVQGKQIILPNYFIAIALHKLARNPISEEEFHKLTNFEYAEQNNEALAEPEGYQNHWNHKPYFYHQNNIWYYVDQQEYAHPIQDERVSALKQLNTTRIFEDDFHHITRGQYQEYLGLAYLPEKIIIEDKIEIHSLDDLYQQILKFSKELYYFLEHQDITDNRSIRSLSEIFIKMGFLDLSEIPRSITNSLLKDERSGDERSINLILELISNNFKV